MVTLKSYENGFKYIEISNAAASAKIALQGAHVYEYKRSDGHDVLWLSNESAMEEGIAIRGGVPVCWPRFGTLDESMPAHGFTRTAKFEFIGSSEISESLTQVRFILKDSAESRSIWDYRFELELIVSIGETLVMELKTTNRDTKEFMITQALHSYFSVSHIDDVKIKNLEKKPYLDTLVDKNIIQNAEIKVDQEIDRVYQDVDKEILLEDKNRTLSICNSGSSSVVIWNPWIEKGSRMSGMNAEAYKEFICIESSNAFDDYVIIQPDKSHSLIATISVKFN